MKHFLRRELVDLTAKLITKFLPPQSPMAHFIFLSVPWNYSLFWDDKPKLIGLGKNYLSVPSFHVYNAQINISLLFQLFMCINS